MATLKDVRAGLGARLLTIPGLVVHKNLAEITTLGDGGGAVVGGQTGDLVGAMARGNVTWDFPIYVLASTSDYDRATEILDELVDTKGERSVFQAIWSDRSLGIRDSNNLVDVDAHVDALTAYGVEFASAGIPHIAAVLNCVVHTPGHVT